jgi:hypothetical protein
MIVLLLTETIEIMEITKQYQINTLNCELHPISNEYFLYHLQMSNPTKSQISYSSSHTTDVKLTQQ